MSALHKAASFLRWRLIPVRYVTRLGGVRMSQFFTDAPPKSALSEEIDMNGFAAGPRMPADRVAQANEIYQPRIREVVRERAGYSFQNIVAAEDFNPDNPVFRFAMSQQVLDVAFDYFGGRPLLDSIQVNYSWPTAGKPLQSQLWHKDYGDSRSLHCITYLNDVLTVEGGPFVFVDKQDTRRIARSPIIRRIEDTQFAKELGDGAVRYFYGSAGESVFVDPAVCYHFGSRCVHARLAIFVTFNSRFPFAQPIPLIVDNAQRIFDAARVVRPDLGSRSLRQLLQLS